jgi:triosephosphate isomerase
MTRRLMAGTGWKMNMTAAGTRAYAAALAPLLSAADVSAIDLFVLPPFTSLHAAKEAFAGSPVRHGGQNMHWDDQGAWTGEVSAPMLVEAGCAYVELAHSERLQHFGETYDLVRKKLNAAIRHGLTPILCLGEVASERDEGRADAVLAWQVETALADQPPGRVVDVVLAYEPRWAIGAADAASPGYVAQRHAGLRALVARMAGADAAARTRILYGGSVNPQNGPDLVALDDVDGLFVGRAAWTAEGFAGIARIVAEAARRKAA